MAAARHVFHCRQTQPFSDCRTFGHAKGLDILLYSLPGKSTPYCCRNVDKSSYLWRAGTRMSDNHPKICGVCMPPLIAQLYHLCISILPTVCSESMAMNRPSRRQTHGGAKEAMIHNKTGWIVDPVDASKKKQAAWIAAQKRSRRLWCLCEKHGARISLKNICRSSRKIYTDTLRRTQIILCALHFYH